MLVILGALTLVARPHILLVSEVFYSKETPRASGLLYPTKRGEAFLQEQEPGTIAERNLALSN